MKKKIAMVVLWLAALVCCLCMADHFMRRDDSERKYGPFFEDKNGFDVLFFGTSRVLDGITPMELWRDYGITAYNMGNNSEPLGMTKWTLDLASDVQLLHEAAAAAQAVLTADPQLALPEHRALREAAEKALLDETMLN